MKTYFLELKCEGLKIFLTFCFGPFPFVAFPICKIVPSELCFKHCTPNSSSSIYFLNISLVQLSHIQGQRWTEISGYVRVHLSGPDRPNEPVNMPFQEIMPSNRGRTRFQWNNQLEMHDLSLLREHACRKQSNPQSKRILETVTSLCNITLLDRSRFNICYRVGFRKITKNRS